MVSPGLICNTGWIIPEKYRWNCVGAKSRVCGVAFTTTCRRATQSKSSFSRFAFPFSSAPETWPLSSANFSPLGRVAVDFTLLPSTVPSSFNSLRLPESLFPSTFSSSFAWAISSPKLTILKFHDPAISAAGNIAALAITASRASFLIDHDSFRVGTLVPLRSNSKRTQTGRSSLWQQNDNVPFEQSRNVPLTAPSFGDARRTTTDDPSRARPASDAEESQEETDYTARGSRGTGAEYSAGEAPAVCHEEARR